MLIYTQQPACMNVYVLHYANHCSRHYTQQTVEANPEKDLSVGFFTVKEVPVLRCYFFPSWHFSIGLVFVSLTSHKENTCSSKAFQFSNEYAPQNKRLCRVLQRPNVRKVDKLWVSCSVLLFASILHHRVDLSYICTYYIGWFSKFVL